MGERDSCISVHIESVKKCLKNTVMARRGKKWMRMVSKIRFCSLYIEMTMNHTKEKGMEIFAMVNTCSYSHAPFMFL